ncbi:hypothetical protein LTR84_000970 [Exophiala bonariae]|uniref:Xylanolytic transcriptional activator regulatory domain-containing protein n=1 Tax=Exophiala bonariae TaxID=1690606 RepID=A0AAV9NTT0_9EURO|nr:hypothetical protein LTR84_000970 [Exophiala bonariae]
MYSKAARRRASQVTNNGNSTAKSLETNSATTVTERSTELLEGTVGDYVQVLLAATSDQNSTDDLSEEATDPTGPHSYDFQTAALSNEPGREHIVEATGFSGVVPSSGTSQAIDLSVLQVPGAHTNELDFDPVSFAQTLDGLDSANWLLEDEFDISIFDNLNTWHTPDLQNILSNDTSEQLLIPQRAPPINKRTMPNVSDLRHHWYTQVPLMASGFAIGSRPMTPGDVREDRGEDIDESYRAKMASKLRFPERNEPLPTIEFMNLCIHLFFTRFNVALPIVHGPTFRPTTDTALLVLSICSAGTLCLGSDVAARTGCMLFERVNKAHLSAPFERYISRRPAGVRTTLKASMIGQTFALLSEHPYHLTTASSYHGTLISVARHARILGDVPKFILPGNLSAKELHKAWLKWAQAEEMKRLYGTDSIALLLHIHDAELAALFHHEPIFRHNTASLPTISSAELFNAPSAAVWAARLRKEEQISILDPKLSAGSRESWAIETRQRTPMLLRYARLSGLSASIAECRYLKQLTFEMIAKLESELIFWHRNFSEHMGTIGDHNGALSSTTTEAPFSLMPLWHYSFITLMADINVLELAIGKEGSDVASSVREYVVSWLSSPDSKRCLLHALLLQNFMVNTSMGSVMAIHTPRILFASAVCWACYMLYRPSVAPLTSSSNPNLNSHSTTAPPTTDTFSWLELELLPEIRALDSMSHTTQSSSSSTTTTTTFIPSLPSSYTGKQAIGALKSILNANNAEMKAATLCVLETMLRRLGASGISRRFADIIQILIAGDGRDEWAGTD